MPSGKNNGGSSSIKGCELGESEGGGGGAGDGSPRFCNVCGESCKPCVGTGNVFSVTGIYPLAGWVTPPSNPLSSSLDGTVIVTSATVGGGEGEVILMLEGKLAVGSDSGVVGVALAVEDRLVPGLVSPS